jgi:hypothetical protein
MSPLSAGLLDVGVAELLEFLDEPVAVIALDLDDAVLDGAAGAAFFLELAADLFERRTAGSARSPWSSPVLRHSSYP